MKFYPKGEFYMKKRIDDKINEIKNYLKQLISIKPESLDKYVADFKTKAACERYFEKIAEAVSDLAVLVIKEKWLRVPDEDNEYFEALKNESFISSNLAKKLKEMKGMRNIIAHQYGSIDDELVYTAINDELNDDIKKFIEIVNKLLKQEKIN